MNAIAVLTIVLTFGVSGTTVADPQHAGSAAGHQIGASLKKPVPEFDALKSLYNGISGEGLVLGSIKLIENPVPKKVNLTNSAVAVKGLDALGKMHDALAKCDANAQGGGVAETSQLIRNFVQWLHKISTKNDPNAVFDEQVLRAYVGGIRNIIDTRASVYKDAKKGYWSAEDEKLEEDYFLDIMGLAKGMNPDFKWRPRGAITGDLVMKAVEDIGQLKDEAIKKIGEKLEPVCSMKDSNPSQTSPIGGVGPATATGPGQTGAPADPAATDPAAGAGTTTAGPTGPIPSSPSAGGNKPEDPVTGGPTTAGGAGKGEVDKLKEQIGQLETSLKRAQNADEASRASAASGALAGLDPFIGNNSLIEAELAARVAEAQANALANQQAPNIRGGNSPTNSRDNSKQFSPSFSMPGGGGGGKPQQQGMDPALMAALAQQNQGQGYPMLPPTGPSNLPQITALPTLAVPQQTQNAETSAFSKSIADMSNKLNSVSDYLLRATMGQYAQPFQQGMQSAYTRASSFGQATMNAVRGRFAQSTNSNGGPVNLVGRAKPPSLLR